MPSQPTSASSANSGTGVPPVIAPPAAAPRQHRVVLTRAEQQRILIADGAIVVTLVRARRGRASIAIDAPREIAIQREELVNRG